MLPTFKGHNSLNQYFEGSAFHHMHINGDDTIGIYIPEEMHILNYHGNWRKNRKSIDDINKLALDWLCTQETIEGVSFDPDMDYVEPPRPKIIGIYNHRIYEELVEIKARKAYSSLEKTIESVIENALNAEFLELANQSLLTVVGEYELKIKELEQKIKDFEVKT